MLSIINCIDHEMKIHKKLDKLIEVKKRKSECKFNKMLDTIAKDNVKISRKDKEAHIQRTVLNFSQVEIPKYFSDLLTKSFDHKVAKKSLPLLDMISGVEETMENISVTYMKNIFWVKCLNIVKRGGSNEQIKCKKKKYVEIFAPD